ncbi:MAG: type VI secretion system baseplate subunit TssF [Rubrivivax sp.]|nr:type VI secretion system baseplate subunit TssF [Rubrivivax sp.]
MNELLPHYERELAFLRAQAAGFAQQYPKIAGRLELTGDVGEDPHVERLIESFALLAARVHKRLDDDFPLFTESFLEVLYPHYLRPFPSCAIARFDLGAGAAQLSKASVLPRGTPLTSRAVRGVNCRFRTTYDVQLAPLRVASAAFRGSTQVPAGTTLPRGATSLLSVQLQLDSPQATWAGLGLSTLRLALDGEASQVAALREALFGAVRGVLVQTQAAGPWLQAADAAPREVGFADEEALLDADPRCDAAYRLLTEYFAFPDKFNFVDLPLPPVLLSSSTRNVTLHYALAGIRNDSDTARLLETITERNLLTHCTPVANLFKQRADPIRVTHESERYAVLPDARRAFGFEVVSVDKVFRVQKTPQGEHIHEFVPFYSLRHDELLAEGEGAGRYWTLQRDATLAERSPGYEASIAIVDINFDPAQPQTDTLSLDVTATNRDLPTSLSAGTPGGDLTQEGGSIAREIRLLRKPTPSARFETGRGALWRLISHLSVNHLSLSGGGLDALKELLRLYDLPRSAINRRLVDALVAVDYQPTSACLPGEPFPTFVRGIHVRLTVDEGSFVGAGLRLFAQVLDHFLGLYVHANSFTQLTLVSARTQETLMTCPPRSGQSPLL